MTIETDYQGPDAPTQEWVWRCKACGKEVESKRDANAHAPAHREIETVTFEMVDRDPAKRLSGHALDILLLDIPTPVETAGKMMRAIEQYGANRMERDPDFAERLKRRIAEPEKASKATTQVQSSDALRTEPTANQMAASAADAQSEQAKPENDFKSQSQTTRRSVIVTIALFVLGIPIAFTINVASASLPEEWKPYLWLSWPLLAILVILGAILSRWQAKKMETNNP